MRLSRTLPLLVAFLLPLQSSAQSPATEEYKDSVTLQLRDDFYMAGNNVSLDAYNGIGDVTVAGSNVTIGKAVDGTLQAAGSNVLITEEVTRNVRVAGGTVTIGGNVGGNVIAFGGEVIVLSGAVIRGDILAAGGKITINGVVLGNAHLKGDMIALPGNISGMADIRAEKFSFSGDIGRDATIGARTWDLGSEPAVGGNLKYWHPDGENAMTNLIVGEGKTYDETLKMHHEETKAAGFLAALLGAISLYSFFSAALVIGLLMLLTRTYFRDAAVQLEKKPWQCLLFGFLFFLVVPAVALLFAMTLIGLPITLLLVGYFVFAIMFAKPFTALVLARYLERRGHKKWNSWIVFLVALGMYVVLKLLMIVPFVGWIIVMLAVFCAFGAMIMTKYDKYLQVR